MRKLFLAVALGAFVTTPAFAGECPLLHGQLMNAIGNRVDDAAYKAKQMGEEAHKLHSNGKHPDSIKKYDEAAKVAGVTLKHKK